MASCTLRCDNYDQLMGALSTVLVFQTNKQVDTCTSAADYRAVAACRRLVLAFNGKI